MLRIGNVQLTGGSTTTAAARASRDATDLACVLYLAERRPRGMDEAVGCATCGMPRAQQLAGLQ